VSSCLEPDIDRRQSVCGGIGSFIPRNSDIGSGYEIDGITATAPAARDRLEVLLTHLALLDPRLPREVEVPILRRPS